MSITATDPNFGTWVIAKERGNKVRRRQIGTGIWTAWEHLAKPVDVDDKLATETIAKLTRDELRALAKSLGLKGYGKLTKAGLIELVSQ
ncbi:hypothetical protein BJD55_gp035 [Gordonia phage Yvonnetastic]|uniref:Rho termination factor N-terminal domain-containing protein n=1 Tax=Gordonia phage Yvonnetastic TaxID=1821566 RepID=A0A142K9E8_9CAUD|nr:hypothetical protein BJD55_gp035 [Gordonia phage Yvonnetastic]AMS02731.1 hypothetical protein SEA_YVONNETASTIC_187 [Gordonia phage Yvonnetastic]